jgi:hypothetical protein
MQTVEKAIANAIHDCTGKAKNNRRDTAISKKLMGEAGSDEHLLPESHCCGHPTIIKHKESRHRCDYYRKSSPPRINHFCYFSFNE